MVLRSLATASLIVACLTGIAPVRGAQDNAEFRRLFDQHRWFDLRGAIKGTSVPALYSGAVDAAFGRDAAAERELIQAVREAANADLANDAREALVSLYFRNGRSSEAVRTLDAALAASPTRTDLANARLAFGPLLNEPDQSARIGRSAPFACEVRANGIVLPIDVNGRRVRWNFDSGFSNVAVTESEAKMLGIAAQSGSADAGDFAGGTTKMRTGIADRIAIGDAELRHVPVLIFSDSQPPWNERPQGTKGTLGLPAILALRGIRWTSGGTCAVGPGTSVSDGGSSELLFDGMTLLVRASVGRAMLEFVVDTGNESGTQLWSRFAAEFPETMRAGRTRSRSVNQIGGSNDRTVTELPELRIAIGSFNAILRPANVFAKPVGNEFQHGNLGMDVHSQAADVRIDFQRMVIRMSRSR